MSDELPPIDPPPQPSADTVPDGVDGNTPDLGSGVPGSNPGPATTPAEPPAASFPTTPPISELPLDEERAILDGIIPGMDAGGGKGKRRLGQGSQYGRFVAARMLEKPNFRESELLNHRAKVAFVDGAALAVPLYFSELGKPKPNKVILDGAMAAMRGAGIVVDSVPVSQQDRAKQIDVDREAASMSNEDLMRRQQERLRAMNGEKGEA